MTLHDITTETCVVRNTGSRRGRTQAIAPGSSKASRYLHYGRIVLDAADAARCFDAGARETALVCLKGSEHEHAAMLEEAYLYVDMPAPSFGVQLVYTDGAEPELATIVHEGDVVLIPKGYHPNVAAPGGSIKFLWMMAAARERENRQYGVVNVQPEFAAIPTGRDKGR